MTPALRQLRRSQAVCGDIGETRIPTLTQTVRGPIPIRQPTLLHRPVPIRWWLSRRPTQYKAIPMAFDEEGRRERMESAARAARGEVDRHVTQADKAQRGWVASVRRTLSTPGPARKILVLGLALIVVVASCSVVVA